MDKILITGGKALNGTIYASGAKNATLPIMAATLLTKGEIEISNIPDLKDVNFMSKILSQHGAKVDLIGKSDINGSGNRKMIIRCDNITNFTAPYDLVRKMRASALVLGPLLARFGKAIVSLPGGCAIGTRPVDLHLYALRKMGAQIKIQDGYIHAQVPDGLIGADIHFDVKSVGATETILMSATIAKGTTIIRNAAKEPDICDLAELLIKMGAKIKGHGTDTIQVDGVPSLHGATHNIVSDRIEAMTYVIAGIITNGQLTVKNIDIPFVKPVIDVLIDAGANLEIGGNYITTLGRGKLNAIDLHTMPHPGFPTDLQAQMMALLTLADGTSHIHETIFENRFMHVPELNRMCANITTDGHTAIVKGVEQLRGAEVMATDIRASVSLILAALAADGRTTISRVYHIDRGYEHVEEKLRACGAEITRVLSQEVTAA